MHFGNAILGLIFVAVGSAATFLMYYLWGFPFDHKTNKSDAPPRLMLLHRALGYVYLGIFIYLMYQMVPRLWTYQVELPPRTVAHLIIGMTIGITLLIKMIIVRFFKHLEGTLAPFLGTLLLICTIVLIGLSVPTALRERLVSRESGFQPASVERVRAQFALAGLDAGNLAVDDLRAGRRVLADRCTACHDLRTVLARPRTATDWRTTVQRMAERAEWFNPIGDRDQIQVIAYLVSISPGLQDAAKQKRQQDQATESVRTAAKLMRDASMTTVPYDATKAKRLFETKCTQCHELRIPDASTAKTAGDIKDLVARMVGNGLSATDAELQLITQYLVEKTIH